MPTAPALARPQSRTRFHGGQLALIVVALAVCIISLFAINSVLLSDPARVDITLENPTDYELNVRVRSSPDDDALGLGPIGPRSSKDYLSVIDQGEVWIFEYTYSGVVAGTNAVDRAELRAGPIQVPPSVGVELRRAGFEPRR